MTKSPRSVTKKLQLASLFRWLALLCFIKLAIFMMILLDIPFGTIQNHNPEQVSVTDSEKTPIKESREPLEQSTAQITKQEDQKLVSQAPLPELPQGVDAVKLAQSLKPKQQQTGHSSVIAAQKSDPQNIDIATEQALLSNANLKLPKPLPAPIAKAGETPEPKYLADNNALPVPTLGSATAAKAAASMPIPNTGPAESNFAPVEQQAPLTIPGAPDLPNNIRPGVTNGQPLPPLKSTNMPTPTMPTNPQTTMGMTTESQELQRQQQDILILKKQMDDRLKELQESEAKMKRVIKEANLAEESKLKSMIAMFANMKPKTAAKALEKMSPATACQILSGMTSKQSGDILSYTNPQVTAKLTELLARMKTY